MEKNSESAGEGKVETPNEVPGTRIMALRPKKAKTARGQPTTTTTTTTTTTII